MGINSMPMLLRMGHPFTAWARTIGGILQVSGFSDFLGNYSLRRTSDDPVRRSLGYLGAARPGKWLTASAWGEVAVNLGLNKMLAPDAEKNCDEALAREMGIVLSAHVQESFVVETDDEILKLRLEKARRRFEQAAEPSQRYRFDVLERQALVSPDHHQN
jgi:hypothetical protein